MIVPKTIIDAHVHLDISKYGSVDRAFEALRAERASTNISHVVLLALDKLGLGNHDLARLADRYPFVVPFMSLHPYSPDAVTSMDALLQSHPFRGLKLHPRFQKFDLDDGRVRRLVSRAAEHGLPVIIDSFPYYPDYYADINPDQFHRLARSVPEATIIIAHACAHRVIDAMFVAKANQNVYLDISFSLLYFRGSSVTDDMGYVIRSLQGNRLLYGSDYPDRELTRTLELTLEALEPYNLDETIMARLFHDNAASLFGIENT